MIKEITMDEINPCLRTIDTYSTPSDFTPIKFRSYSHRFYFFENGKGTFVVNNNTYPMKKNSLILVPDGFAFELYPQKTNIPQIMIVFNYTPPKEEWKRFPDSPPAEYFDDNAPRERVVFTDMPVLNDVICLHNMGNLHPYLIECLHEFRLQKAFHAKITSILLQFIIQTIIRVCAVHKTSQTHVRANDYVDTIINYIHENYNSPDISNGTIGKLFNLHPNYINHLIRKRTSYSLHQYINNVRIENAILLLGTTKMSVAEVGSAVGYVTVSYFSKYFKMKTGKSPSEYSYKFLGSPQKSD